MMIQEKSIFAEDGENAHLDQYKLINQHLRRKIKEKDIKIMQLFDCIDEANKQIAFTPQSILAKSHHRERSVRLTFSDKATKGKENAQSCNAQSSNVFKQPSLSLISKLSRKQLILPVLGQARKSIYPAQDSIIQNPESKAKMVRIPLDRLKPLNYKEVKKRFLMKFQRQGEESLQKY